MTTAMTARSTADDPDPAGIAERVWDLMTMPASWPAWAPHMRHVRGFRPGTAPARISPGDRLRIDVRLPALLPVTITDLDPGRSWTMTANVPAFGVVTSRHDLSVRGTNVEVVTRVTVERGGLAARSALRLYQPVAVLALNRLTSIARGEQGGQDVARLRMCQPQR